SASKSSSRSPAGAATRKSAKAAGGRSKRAGRAPARGSATEVPHGSLGLAALSTEALAAELRRRRRELPKLEKRAAALRADLAAVERRIAELGGAAGSAVAAAPSPRAKGRRASGAGRGRAASRGGAAGGGRVTLGSRIAAFLGGRAEVASPKEIAGAMAAELGREMTSSFYVQTNLALRKLCESGAVEQVGRAQYRATGAAATAEPVAG
ncbi:MAG: hypothetical protein RI967_849, partial [Planctomycetota bacterium]